MQQPEVDHTRIVVGITGGSGSGKTTFAKRLLCQLGQRAVLLSQDDYYKHLPYMTAQEAAAHNFDSPDAIETNLLVEHLCMLKSGVPIDAPSYDFAAHARINAARRIEPVPIVIVEGLLIMCDPDLPSLIDLAIFIDVDPDVRALRRIVRDCRERGANLEQAVDMYLGTCKPAHERHVEPFKQRADIIIENAQSDTALGMVIERIDSLLGT